MVKSKDLESKVKDSSKNLAEKLDNTANYAAFSSPVVAETKAENKIKDEIKESKSKKVKAAAKFDEPAVLPEEKKERVGSKSDEMTPKELKKYKEKIAKLKKKGALPAPKRIKADYKSGLTKEQVDERTLNGYTNYVKRGSTKTVWNILLSNFFTFFNILCFVIAGLLIYVGSYFNLTFMVIFVANLAIGIIQELKAKYTIEKLSLLSANTAKVVRDGETVEISVDNVVLDDIIILSAGKQIPSDCTVIEGFVEVNESLLTGESNAIQKTPGGSMLAGSFIVSGVCHARVEKVGIDSYVQTLTSQAKKYKKPKSELLRSLSAVIKTVGVAIPVLGFLLFYTNIKAFGTFKLAIPAVSGAIIGMIPAGMFLLTSVALAVGVVNLAKSNTLVQELYCIEMLARVDVLCLDKTGTITDGTMKVCDVVEVKNTSDYTIREIVASMLFALNDNNQTAIALGNHFDRVGILKTIATMPFSSQRKLSAVSFEREGTYILGAPEFVLKETFEKVDEKINRFVSQGYRVLILARAPGVIKNNSLPDGIKPVAIISIRDHVRAEAPKTIEWFRNNGVDVKVISGDNPITVSEVAKRAGIVGADKFVSLDGMSNNDVRAAVSQYNIFGRVSPEQKLIIIQELKHMGKTVAMTGDGVNDILALREADCSIAMNNASEAARNASHLVLLDNNFASMPKVVNEGRRVVNNIQKSSSLFLTKTIFTILLAIFTVSLGMKYLFEPKQLMAMELFIIGIPSTMLALELNNKKIKGKFILNVLKNSFVGGLIMFLSIVAIYILRIAGILALTDAMFTTMSLYAVTIIGIFVLIKVASPLNAYRGILVALMIVFVTLALIYFPWFFGLEVLEQTPKLILIIILLIAYPLMNFIISALQKIKLMEKDEQ